MHVEHQNMFLLRQLDRLAADERPPGQIEARRGVGLTESSGLTVALLPSLVMAYINAFELEIQAVQDQLPRLAILAREDGAQILMPRNNQIERLFELVDIQLAPDCDRSRNIVAGAVGLELINKPQPFLGEAQREPVESSPVDGSYRGNIASSRLRDQLGQLGDAASLEQRLQRQVDVQPATNLRDQLGGQQRMPPELEEVVVDSDLLRRQVQDLRPDLDQSPFRLVARRQIFPARFYLHIHARQRAAI